MKKLPVLYAVLAAACYGISIHDRYDIRVTQYRNGSLYYNESKGE